MRIRTYVQVILREVLIFPDKCCLEEDYGLDPTAPEPVGNDAWDERPNLEEEAAFFRRPRNGNKIDVESLYNFIIFDADGVATIDDRLSVRFSEVDNCFSIVEDGLVVAEVPNVVTINPHFGIDNTIPASMPQAIFEPPAFGITMLGSSHGFDPKGVTSGFVLWMNRRGIMVDPPPASSQYLEQRSIPRRLIQSIILTHCHADHAAGTFQKILDEGRITLMTTTTIMVQFLKKFSKTTRLPKQFLAKIFDFRQVKISEKFLIHGGYLRFFYSLHAIPCIGFEAFFGGKSLVYSADTMNDVDTINMLYDEKILSAKRRDFLLRFPWHHDVVLHEAGVPPIHTPLSTFYKQPAEVRKNIYLVHISAENVKPALEEVPPPRHTTPRHATPRHATPRDGHSLPVPTDARRMRIGFRPPTHRTETVRCAAVCNTAASSHSRSIAFA